MGSSWLLGSGKYPLKQSHRHWHTVPLLSGNAGEVIPTLPQALLGFSRAAEPLSQGCISHRHLALQRASPPPQDTVFPVTRSTFSVELALSSSLPSVRPLESVCSADGSCPGFSYPWHGRDGCRPLHFSGLLYANYPQKAEAPPISSTAFLEHSSP